MNGGIIIALICKHAIHFTSQYRWDSQLILAPSGIPPAKQHRDWRQPKQRQKIFQSRIAGINVLLRLRCGFSIMDTYANVTIETTMRKLAIAISLATRFVIKLRGREIASTFRIKSELSSPPIL